MGEGTKDVLIGTDVASKGLDFPAIQHVINFDMPKEVENYIHRIGRTGRCGRTGIATTFVNKNDDETILMDLKAILLEANQRLPPFLKDLEPPGGFREVGGIKGTASRTARSSKRHARRRRWRARSTLCPAGRARR